ncbi:MAG: HEAT repeat domain-containing protein [Micropepsaceae bacterium]
MIRRLLAATALSACLPAFAEDQPPFNLTDYPQRMEAAVAACADNPEGGACRAHLLSVLPSTVEALSFLGYESNYDEAAPLLRDMAAYPVPQVQAAAIYALARLTPRAEDLPVLREALLSDVPAVRRAALGALKLLPDTQAQELAGRAARMPSGSNFEADSLPFDPAAMGLPAWPAGTRFLHFQQRPDSGGYAFVTAAPVTDLIAAFEAQSGRKAIGMGEIEARFGAAFADRLAPFVQRNASLGAVQAILLADPETVTDSAPAIVAFVYEDYALAAPGFAIQRLPGTDLPRPRMAEAPPPPKPEGDAAQWWSTGHLAPKPGASDDDAAAWRAVLNADGDGAEEYLAAFPEGAWRAEAEALLVEPSVTSDQEVYSETDPIKVTWRGLPADFTGQLALGRAGDERLNDTIGMSLPDIVGASGSVDLAFYAVAEPGVYDLRIVDGEGEAIAITQLRIAVAAATLTPESDNVRPGTEMKIAFSGMAGHERDFISIVKKGEPADKQGSLRVETGAVTEGNITIVAPKEPGDYELRAWYGRDARVRARVPFTVRGPDQPPEIADGEGPALALAGATVTANETVLVRYGRMPGSGGQYLYLAEPGSEASAYVGYKDAKGTEGLVEFDMPSEPGAYELRAIAAGEVLATTAITIAAPENVAQATLTLEKTGFAPGETIAVTFEGMSGSGNDYIAVAEAGSRYRQYVSYVSTKGEVAGRAELKAPEKPGTYEIRAFYKDDPRILRGTQTITVTGAP